jgi:predicted nuclease of predicted toxin-antitoxin system
VRVLLDENLDHRLKRFFGEEHAVVTVRERGWSGKENGELIQDAQREFDALVTMDQGIPHQQNLMEVDLVILLLEAPSNRLADTAPLVEKAKVALSEARPGEVVRVQRP